MKVLSNHIKEILKVVAIQILGWIFGRLKYSAVIKIAAKFIMKNTENGIFGANGAAENFPENLAITPLQLFQQ